MQKTRSGYLAPLCHAIFFPSLSLSLSLLCLKCVQFRLNNNTSYPVPLSVCLSVCLVCALAESYIFMGPELLDREKHARWKRILRETLFFRNNTLFFPSSSDAFHIRFSNHFYLQCIQNIITFSHRCNIYEE